MYKYIILIFFSLIFLEPTTDIYEKLPNHYLKDLDNKNMTLFPELDIKEDTKERPKIDEEVLKSVILVYQNDKFEILKKK